MSAKFHNFSEPWSLYFADCYIQYLVLYKIPKNGTLPLITWRPIRENKSLIYSLMELLCQKVPLLVRLKHRVKQNPGISECCRYKTGILWQLNFTRPWTQITFSITVPFVHLIRSWLELSFASGFSNSNLMFSIILIILIISSLSCQKTSKTASKILTKTPTKTFTEIRTRLFQE